MQMGVELPKARLHAPILYILRETSDHVHRIKREFRNSTSSTQTKPANLPLPNKERLLGSQEVFLPPSTLQPPPPFRISGFEIKGVFSLILVSLCARTCTIAAADRKK